MVVEGVMMVFQAFFGSGTFGERLGILLTGFGKIFGGLGTILFSVGKVILKLAVGLVVGVVALYFKMILKLLRFLLDKKFRNAIIKKISDFFSNWWNNKIGGFKGLLEKIGLLMVNKVLLPLFSWG